MGIVAGVGAFLFEHACNIIESAQFGDPKSSRFFMRVSFSSAGGDFAEMQREFAAVAERFGMQWALDDMAVKPRVLVMVSRFGHCLNDLLYRWRIGALPVDITAIVSNHRDWYKLAAAHDIPYHHLPVTTADKPRRERQLLDIFEEERCDLLDPRALHADPVAGAVRPPRGARHQHSPFVPAQFSGSDGPTSRRTIAASSSWARPRTT